ncbi:uncharacterized protein LOC126896168 isoform X2 [Daktulosphaira vitifoliae]|uniref:uncharacterized protein LOC126896168 isoform X1 n=1 Tax=Daktulosphaira vitifoliae TaxID=58002 RepID=UPI0021A9A3D3|nr:uncharacterized protein LOC126896168 isoform X1 [Daktulosphaira vitifoliae]XP_050524663.1 uncharacterized protein LOC126896168 isoform X1 [Daktulosphaira vitifoliae]XP_050524664.1 uncharacterized protein LOC126896168 isoform X2 [Daktulosphaira vitifoliae]
MSIWFLALLLFCVVNEISSDDSNDSKLENFINKMYKLAPRVDYYEQDVLRLIKIGLFKTNLNDEEIAEMLKEEWPFIMSKKHMAFTNYLLANIIINEQFNLDIFVQFMSINCNLTFDELKKYFVPPNDDIFVVSIREGAIRDNITDYFVSTGNPKDEPEEWLNYDSSKTTLLKEYQKRYTLMKEIYNISDKEIEGLKHNTLIKRNWDVELE